MKISIGTAQFGFNYGICNKNGIVSKREVKKIFDYSKFVKINSIDTAQGYGKSHKVISSFKLKDFQITSKISNIKKIHDQNLDYRITLEVNKILRDLNSKKLYALLIHDISQLKSKNGKKFYRILEKLKVKKKFIKLGVSVYTRNELDFVIKNYNIDIVNLPISVANQEFLQKNYLSKIKNKNIEIHARSIFLQGLLLCEYKFLPKKFKNNKFFIEWFKWLKVHKYNPLDASLEFIKGIKHIDKIVIGIDNFSQLESIVKSYKKNSKLKYKKFFQSSLLKNPSTW
tara:strand:- start:54 stop:908 length:855 start_codon:yes stop_codon:yes gene_type:complete